MRFESGVSHGEKAGVFAETASLRRQSRFLDGPEQDARGFARLDRHLAKMSRDVKVCAEKATRINLFMAFSVHIGAVSCSFFEKAVERGQPSKPDRSRNINNFCICLH